MALPLVAFPVFAAFATSVKSHVCRGRPAAFRNSLIESIIGFPPDVGGSANERLTPTGIDSSDFVLPKIVRAAARGNIYRRSRETFIIANKKMKENLMKVER